MRLISVNVGVVCLLTVLLPGCGSKEAALETRTEQLTNTLDRAGPRTVSREAALHALITHHQIVTTGTPLADLPRLEVEAPAVSLDIAAQLAELLFDQQFVLKKDQDSKGVARVTQLHIGADERANLFDALSSLDWRAKDVDEDALVGQLGAVSALERLDMLDQIELDETGVQQMRAVLHSDPNTEARLAVLARLDLGDTPEARQVVLESLGDGADSVVQAALYSVERWGDSSSIDHLEPLLTHANPDIVARVGPLITALQVQHPSANSPVPVVASDPAAAIKNARLMQKRIDAERKKTSDTTE